MFCGRGSFCEGLILPKETYRAADEQTAKWDASWTPPGGWLQNPRPPPQEFRQKQQRKSPFGCNLTCQHKVAALVDWPPYLLHYRSEEAALICVPKSTLVPYSLHGGHEGTT